MRTRYTPTFRETIFPIQPAMFLSKLRNGLSVAALWTVVLSSPPSGGLFAQVMEETSGNVEAATTAGAARSKATQACAGCAQSLDLSRMTELLEMLGSDSFEKREQASECLLQIGEPALEQVKDYRSDRFEVQNRVGKIVQRLETERFNRISRCFLLGAETDAGESCGLPAWKCYCGLVGSSRTSKLLFLDMIRCQPELVNSIDRTFCQCELQAKQEELPRLLAETRELSSRLHNDRLVRMLVPEIGDIVSVLLATSLLEGTAPVEVNELLASSVNSLPVSTYMHRRGYGKVLRTLYSCWIPKTHQSMAEDVLRISLQDNYTSGVEIARKYLDKHFDVRLRESSIQCLARFGDESDLPRLLPLLEDNTLCKEFPAGQIPGFGPGGIQESHELPPGLPATGRQGDDSNEPMLHYRVCDLALASSMMIKQWEMQTVFPQFETDETFAFDVRSIVIERSEKSLDERGRQIDWWKRELETLLAAQSLR